MFEKKEIDIGTNIYDLNKINMANIPVLTTEEEFTKVRKKITKYLDKKLGSYYMMLNYEKRYFTLFNFRHWFMTDAQFAHMAQDVLECVTGQNLQLIDIMLNETEDALEIWTKDQETNEAFMYLLFPYDNGVLEY